MNFILFYFFLELKSTIKIDPDALINIFAIAYFSMTITDNVY